MKTYHWIAADLQNTPRIHSLGYSDNPKVTQYASTGRGQYIIHLVLSGKGFFNGNEVCAGQGFLITPHMQEDYHPDAETPWSFLWIISEDPEMQYFFDRFPSEAETGIFPFHNRYEAEAVIARLATIPNHLPPAPLLSELFLHLFHSCIATETSARPSPAKIYFEFSVNYIKTNLHTPISVDTLCRTVGITQPYLYKIFKKETGDSPKQYISGLKILKAKRLLTETDLSVSRVADSVGFESVIDFSKFFSRQTGMSPSAYREKNS